VARTFPEHVINLTRCNKEWNWHITNHGAESVLLSGVADTAEEAHIYAFVASIWLSNPEDEASEV
jgi:phosphoribosylamine-glycine ligase